MKIVFVQHSSFLNGNGGTEKICVFLANGFSKLGHEVIIAASQAEGGGSVFPLEKNVDLKNIYDENVDQINLLPLVNYRGVNPFKWIIGKIKKKYAKAYNKSQYRKFKDGEAGLYRHNLKNRALHWEKFLKELNPDVIVTMSISSLLEITYGTQLNIPIVNSVNGRPDYDFTDVIGYRPAYEMECLTESFKKLDGIQVLFDSYHQFLPETFGGIAKTIANPLPRYSKEDLPNHLATKKEYVMMNLARLDNECKQQSLAIEAFSKVADRFPNWRLEFWGTGRDENLLQGLIESLQLADRVFLKGFHPNPEEILRTADIFIFPSKYEGFGLALGEAMAMGIPSLGLASCSGVNELIKHGETGFLAEDKESLIDYLSILMEDAEKRALMGAKGHEFSKAFDSEVIFQKWNGLLLEVVDQNKKITQ